MSFEMRTIVIIITGIRVKAYELICSFNPEVFLCLVEMRTENVLMLMQGRLAEAVNTTGGGLLRTNR